MDATIPNLDEATARALKARGALDGNFLGRPEPSMKRPASLDAFRPEPFPPGNEQLSEEIDRIVYGG